MSLREDVGLDHHPIERRSYALSHTEYAAGMLREDSPDLDGAIQALEQALEECRAAADEAGDGQ